LSAAESTPARPLPTIWELPDDLWEEIEPTIDCFYPLAREYAWGHREHVRDVALPQPVRWNVLMQAWWRAYVQWSRNLGERRPVVSFLVAIASGLFVTCFANLLVGIGSAYPFELDRWFWEFCGIVIVVITIGTIRARRRKHSSPPRGRAAR